jgi:hypothetical protein
MPFTDSENFRFGTFCKHRTRQAIEMKGFLQGIDLSSISPSINSNRSCKPVFNVPEWLSHVMPGIRKSSCVALHEEPAIKLPDLHDGRRLRSSSDAGDEAVILNDLHSPRPHEAPSDFRGWYKLSLGSSSQPQLETVERSGQESSQKNR